MLMRKVFEPAVGSVPGARQNHDFTMDVDYGDESQYITLSLQYQSNMRGSHDGSLTQLTPVEAERLAYLIEERNVHALYRLLARVVQLLNFLSLLQEVETLNELKEVDWGLLHGLTVAQLVECFEGQDRLERLVNSLITVPFSIDVPRVVPSAKADQLANRLSDECYLLFSPGLRPSYIGVRQGYEALGLPKGSTQRISLANQAANNLQTAARHWHSAPLITGRVLHSRGCENFEQIVNRAALYSSPLAKAVEVLLLLDDVVSVVDICLRTASNFQKLSTASVNKSMQLTGATGQICLHWEQNLYHKRNNGNDNESTTRQNKNSPSSPSQIVAVGVAVTSKDAIDTCYALIFYNLLELLRNQSPLALEMISAAAAADDANFLHELFRCLLENSHADTLLRINCPALEKWISDRNEPDLLGKYYTVQGKSFESGEVFWYCAMDSTLNLPLQKRIDYLSRALNSFSVAVRDEDRAGHSHWPTDERQAKLKEAADMLHIAQLQSRILGNIESARRNGTLSISADSYEILSTSIVPVSELYNDYAAEYCLFDDCLYLLHACRHADERVIHFYWKSILVEELLPCATRNENIYNFLRNFLADSAVDESVKYLQPNESSNSLHLFESGGWTKQIESRIINLGNELYGTGFDEVFPVEYLLGLLEGAYYYAFDLI
jgi:nuclear pore complex protein Nup155